MKLLNVCLGNICRSPMAEGILTHLSANEGLDWTIDSAGTGAWHVGESPDRRAIRTCKSRGIDISYQRARQVKAADLEAFDLILAMDESNLQDIRLLKPRADLGEKVGLITELAGVSFNEIPDPYFDGRFDEVFELLWETCNAIVAKYR